MSISHNVKIAKTATVHPSVILEGNISIGEGCYIGPGTVLMGDITVGDHTLIFMNVAIRGTNTIGSYVNIYDMVNIEGGRPYDETGDRSILGDGAWINHGATMHGCEIGEGAVVGINAALDYHCSIGKGAIVMNGSACRVGTVIPENCIAEGVPAQIVKRDITDADRTEWIGLVPSEWVVRMASFFSVPE